MLTPLTLAVSGVFVSVLLMTAAIAVLLSGRDQVTGRRLSELTRISKTPQILSEILSVQHVQSTGILASLATFVKKSPKETSRLNARMHRAGYKSSSAGIVLSLSEMVLPVLLALPPMLLLGGGQRWAVGGLCAAIGFFGPGLFVERQIKTRQRQIEEGLPDALDLLVVCIEAGSGLDQALMKCAEELSLVYPALGEELRQVNTETRAGKPRLEAFKALADRTRVDDIRSLVGMLIQTDRFGTSVGQALRTHSETSRTKRRQRAEEAAQKIGVKLVFPLVLFFFPAFFVIVLGPAALTFMQTFGT
ncbi:MAG: type II secretion system F family protein [Vicinamibacterales bacterium]